MKPISQTKEIFFNSNTLKSFFKIDDLHTKTDILTQNNMFLPIEKTYLNEIILSIEFTKLPKSIIALSVIFSEKKLHNSIPVYKFQGEPLLINNDKIINIAPKQNIYFFGNEKFMSDCIFFDSKNNFDFYFKVKCFKVDSI